LRTKTPNACIGLLNNWKNSPKVITNVIDHESDGIAFAHIGVYKKEKQNKQSIPLPQQHA